jgi:Protein of unknown function (DUF3179)
VLRAEAKGQALHFDYDSLIGGSEVFKDRETGSRWQQALATAISGPLQGTHLALYPFLLTTWGEWNKQHPNTLVLKPKPGYAERMPFVNKVINQGVSGAAAGPAPSDAFSHDDRLRPRETVLGLKVGEEAKAFPLSVLRKVRVVNDKVGGTSVVIVHQPASDTTTAFDAQLNGKTLRFRPADQEASKLVDLETHSSWNAYGLCLSGPLKGSQLKSLILEPEFWFAWSEFHPKTNLYSRKSSTH